MSLIEGIKRFFDMVVRGHGLSVERYVREDLTGESILHVLQYPKEVKEETMEDALKYLRL